MMREEAEHFPPYDFESNVGYPAPVHKAALRGLRPERDPPPLVDLHGAPVLARASPLRRAPVHLALLAKRQRGGSGMSVDLPEVHAAALDATRRSVAGVRDDQWDAAVRLRRLDRARAGEPHRHRQLLGGRARLGARPSRRSATGSTATCSAPTRSRAYDDSALRRRGGVPGAGRDGGAVRGVVRTGARRGLLRAPVHRRADPRVGRRHVDRTGHHARSRAGRGVPRGGRAAARHARAASGVFGDTGSTCPTTPSRQTRLLAVLGRRG